MNRCKFALAMCGSLLMGLAGVVRADDADKAEIARLSREVAAIRIDGHRVPLLRFEPSLHVCRRRVAE